MQAAQRSCRFGHGACAASGAPLPAYNGAWPYRNGTARPQRAIEEESDGVDFTNPY
ncbi:hypothetical protein PT2222_30384 [Paraburkholderia tropica]